MTTWLRRFAFWLRRSRLDDDLAEEIETHRAMRQAQLERSGVPLLEAHVASRRALGNVALAREDARAVWRAPRVDQMMQDLRYGARTLLRKPGFALAAVVTLALGIAGATIMFSIVHAIVLRPLPYHDPDRLVMVWTADPARNLHESATSYPTFLDWRDRARCFANLAFWRLTAGTLAGGGEPERVTGALASASLFPVLGVAPALGRVFDAEDERQRARVVVLSHGLWQRRFGGRAAAIGETLTIDGQPLRIVGVMPKDFYFPSASVQHWTPAILMSLWASKPALAERSWSNRFADLWHVIGRLAPDADVRTAQTQMDAIGRQLTAAHPLPDPDVVGFGVEVVTLLRQVTGTNLERALSMLMGAVGFVLLIACANVASLLLARGASRVRELAVRSALGAGRARLVRLLFVESVLLAVTAGTLATGAAVLAVRGIASVAPPGIPRLEGIAVDGVMLTFAAATSLLSALLFGLVPAWKLARRDPGDALKESGRTAAGAPAGRAWSALIVVECALAVVLLAGAGLLIRSVLAVEAIQPGFDPGRVLVARVHLPIPPSRDWRRQEWETFRTLEERLAALPGVTGAGSITSLLIEKNPEEAIAVEGRPASASGQDGVLVAVDDVTPGFFTAIGARLLRGRYFTHGEQNARLAIVNEAFAARFFQGEDPIGRRFTEGGNPSNATWITIVGVVADMRRQGLERAAFPQFFMPSSEPTMDVAVRTSGGDPAALVPAVRQTIRSVYGNALIVSLAPADVPFSAMIAQRRLQTWMLALFAAVALTLASVGIYGIVHSAVAERRHEFGIRLALGAARGDLLRLVIGEGLRLPVTGLAIGLAGAFAITRLLSHLLFGVTPTDAPTFLAVPALALACALVACWLPARRAARLDPAEALRNG